MPDSESTSNAISRGRGVDPASEARARKTRSADVLPMGPGESPSPRVAWVNCTDPVMAYFDDTPRLKHLVQCSLLTVPLDHGNREDTRTLTLPLVRIRALGSGQAPRPPLFFNPGGPGGMPLEGMAQLRDMWEKNFWSLAQSLPSAYDLVSVHPRGLPGLGLTGDVGLKCRSDVVVEAHNDVMDDQSADNLRRAERATQRIAEACESQPLTPYVTTAQMVGDLEVARRALGYHPLNAVGISYGTRLFASYVATYPHSVGRVLLDSNMNLLADFDANILAMAPERQLQFETMICHLAASDEQKYHLGSTIQDVAGVFTRLAPAVRSVVRPLLFEGPEALMIGRFIDRTIKQFPSIDEPDLKRMVNRHVPHHPELQENLRHLGHAMVEAYFDPLVDDVVRMEAAQSVYVAVRCGTTPSIHDLGYWRQQLDHQVTHYPTASANTLFSPCNFWSGRTDNPPDFVSALSNRSNVMYLQGEYDPSTPFSNVVAMNERIPGMDLVVLEGGPMHGVLGEGSLCVDNYAASFLLHGRQANPGGGMTICHPDAPSGARSRRDVAANVVPPRARGLVDAARRAEYESARRRFSNALRRSALA